ncbi:MAG: hypothetical protein WCO60_17080 [Verrucomicrobiota bacterium]
MRPISEHTRPKMDRTEKVEDAKTGQKPDSEMRRPEYGGRAAAKRAVSMTHVGRSAPVTC